jgi:putative oxidoreductase
MDNLQGVMSGTSKVAIGTPQKNNPQIDSLAFYFYSPFLIFTKNNIAMKKLLSTRYSAGAFSFAMLVIRLIFGILIVKIGYDKLVHFDATSQFMPEFLGLSKKITTALVVFAEFFCGILVILGLFTRLACIPLVICMCYVFFVSNHYNFFGQDQKAIFYLAAFFSLLLVGPGRASVDGMIGK